MTTEGGLATRSHPALQGAGDDDEMYAVLLSDYVFPRRVFHYEEEIKWAASDAHGLQPGAAAALQYVLVVCKDQVVHESGYIGRHLHYHDNGAVDEFIYMLAFPSFVGP